MVRVGQRVLTTKLKVAKILQIEEYYYLVLCDGVKKKIKHDEVFNVIEGPNKPETEDVPYTTIKVGNGESYTRGRPFDLSEEARWSVVLNGASLDVNGIVLKSDPYLTTLSEWGVGVCERYWIVPTHLLSSTYVN